MWTLGRYGSAINLVAILYTAVIAAVLVMPPNQLAGATLAGLLALLFVLYFAETRRKYRGPAWRSQAPGATAPPTAPDASIPPRPGRLQTGGDPPG